MREKKKTNKKKTARVTINSNARYLKKRCLILLAASVAEVMPHNSEKATEARTLRKRDPGVAGKQPATSKTKKKAFFFFFICVRVCPLKL